MVPLVIGSVALLLMGLGAVVDDRRTRVRRVEAEVEPVEAVLPLLHSINDDRCIGCEACVDVCPTEVLELEDHKVRVKRFTDCVQCEQCQNACPTMALVMYRQGTTPRMLTVPELDDHFQTGVPGQYLIGEVAGKPLVKNAANLGRAVVEHIVKELAAGRTGGNDVLDVVIVGSGPGGLSAGLTCLRRKLTCMVLEKEHVISSTVSRYPKGKHFMAEPATSSNVSFLPVFDASKEDLVAAWKQVIDGVKLPIRLGEAVETVQRGDDGLFTVKTTVGTYRARRVVLATGLRGKPRLLVVPGANLEKVQSLLDDPGEFADKDVLVVGGGDSAVEGAMSLADVGARVILSYRGDGFKRCKQGNQKRLAEMVAAHKLTLLLESNVAEFTEREVKIKLKNGSVETHPNQHAFVLIGADTPVAWLEANNVRFVERPHLYTLGASDEVVRRLMPEAGECPKNAQESIALVLGRQQAPARPSVGPKRTVVGRLGHELREAARELTGVFKLADLEQGRGRGRARTPLKGVPALRDGNPFGPGDRTRSDVNPFQPERTVVGASPIRPRPPLPKPPPKKFGFDTRELEAFGDTLPVSEQTSTQLKLYRDTQPNPTVVVADELDVATTLQPASPQAFVRTRVDARPLPSQARRPAKGPPPVPRTGARPSKNPFEDR